MRPIDSYNIPTMEVSDISLSRRGVRKLPQGADFLFQSTWQKWSMINIMLLSSTSATLWIIPRVAMDCELSKSACNTRNITAEPKYTGASNRYEYPWCVNFYNRWTEILEITFRTTLRTLWEISLRANIFEWTFHQETCSINWAV